MIKNLLAGFVLGLILILAIPATLVIASWNAAPGDSTYSIKVSLEKVILGVTASDNLKTSLEIKYTERRFTEVEKLINTTNQNILINESLTNLTNQAIASKDSLQKIQNIEEKTVQTENLINTLESISVKIEEKKQTSDIVSTSTKIPTKIPTNTPIPTVIVIQPSPTVTLSPISIPTPIPSTMVDSVSNLEFTQEVIDGIIDELKTSSNQSNQKKDRDSSPQPDFPNRKDNPDKKKKNN